MTERMQFSFEIDENNNNNNDSRHSNEDAMIITTTNEDDNNAVALGGDITPSTMFVERLVNMLIEKKDDDEDEAAVGYHVLEVLYKMRLKKEENQTLRDAFHNTDIVLHLCTLLASSSGDVTFLNQRISEEEIVHKIIALIVTLTYKDRNGHYKEQFVVANCLTLLVEKLKLYPHNESLVELICTALNNISIHVKKKHTSASTTPRSLITMKQRFTDVIHNYDTMKIFYDVLVAYPNKSNIQESLIACIHAYLSIYKNNQSFIRENLIDIGYMDYIYTLLTKSLKNITSDKSNSMTDPSSTPTPSSTSLLKLTLLLLKAMSSEEKQTRIYLRQKDSIFVFSTIINRYHACKTVELRNNDAVDKTNKLSSLAMDVLKIVYDNTET